jgi:hypothetical protein
MKRKIIIPAAISLIAILLTIGILWANLPSGQEETNLFTYPLSVGNKTYIVTVETNWTEERVPSVTLLNSSNNRYPIELIFLGGTVEKTISYNITIPTDLLWGNISLIRKYYLVNPDYYTLTNNKTHNSLQMTFDYQPFFSGIGYFEILGTQGVW